MFHCLVTCPARRTAYHTVRAAVIGAAFWILTTAHIACAFDSLTEATEEPLSGVNVGFEVDFNSRYVWRGIPWSEGAVMQVSSWIEKNGISFGIWTNTNLERRDGRHTNEIDFCLSRETTRGRLTLKPSFELFTYRYQEDAPSTGELALEISAPLGRFHLVTTHAVDVVKYRGAYFGTAGIVRSLELAPGTTFEASASLGWGSGKFNETYIGPRKWALNLISLELSATRYVSGNAYIRPHVSFTHVLDSDLRAALDDASILCIGLAGGMEF